MTKLLKMIHSTPSLVRLILTGNLSTVTVKTIPFHLDTHVALMVFLFLCSTCLHISDSSHRIEDPYSIFVVKREVPVLLKITTAMLDASINAIAMLQALARLGNMCDVMSLDGFESMRENAARATVGFAPMGLLPPCRISTYRLSQKYTHVECN